jgi:hypothetical protein
MKKSNVLYALHFVWRADRLGVLLLAVYIIWNSIPLAFGALIYKLLIEGGEVQEQGGHAELMARGGRYAHLFNIQASEYAAT